MYDEIFEMIQESYNNGEITFEEAEELNDAAYEKYVLEAAEEDKEEEETEEGTKEELTVEETCEAINMYLENKSARKAFNAIDTELVRKNEKLSDEYNRLDKLAKKVHGTAYDKISKKMNDIDKEYNKNRTNAADKLLKMGLLNKSNQTPGSLGEFMDKQKKLEKSGLDRDQVRQKTGAYYSDMKAAYDKLMKTYRDATHGPYKKSKHDITRTYDKNAASTVEQNRKKYAKESVADTKLAIYEAFDAGQIDSNEKNTLLQLLSE